MHPEVSWWFGLRDLRKELELENKWNDFDLITNLWIPKLLVNKLQTYLLHTSNTGNANAAQSTRFGKMARPGFFPLFILSSYPSSFFIFRPLLLSLYQG